LLEGIIRATDGFSQESTTAPDRQAAIEIALATGVDIAACTEETLSR
jgi:hypothetical protein